jgi:hypothetical protein
MIAKQLVSGSSDQARYQLDARDQLVSDAKSKPAPPLPAVSQTSMTFSRGAVQPDFAFSGDGSESGMARLSATRRMSVIKSMGNAAVAQCDILLYFFLSIFR